jgi:hypothetical protein
MMIKNKYFKNVRFKLYLVIFSNLSICLLKLLYIQMSHRSNVDFSYDPLL